MRILVPIDASEPSERALRFGAELSRRFEGTLHVVHFSDAETDATDQIVDRAREILAEEDIPAEPSVELDVELSFRSADRVGADVLDLVAEDDYEHVVMGHHGGGAVDRIILGSAAETVIRDADVPVTVVP